MEPNINVCISTNIRTYKLMVRKLEILINHKRTLIMKTETRDTTSKQPHNTTSGTAQHYGIKQKCFKTKTRRRKLKLRNRQDVRKLTLAAKNKGQLNCNLLHKIHSI